MKRGLIQEQFLRQFCEQKEFEQHERLQLFRRKAAENWILYRRGNKHCQPMRGTGGTFRGWTFSKSLGSDEERDLYKAVCMHEVAYEDLNERVLFVPKRLFEACAGHGRAKRIYIPSDSARQSFDWARGALIAAMTPEPVFDT